MPTSDSQASIPYEAEQFLARLGAVSQSAWLDIIQRDRAPTLVTIKRFVRGLKLSVLPPRFRRGLDAIYSKPAADRLQRLAENGVLPMHLGWRIYHAAGSALQALCCRSALLEDQFVEMYALFEPHIPFASLLPSGNSP